METHRKITLFYEFAGFRLDVANRVLVRQGQPVDLFPKAFDTLLFLIQNSGRILEKDELMKVLWPESYVEEGNLSQNIFILRKTLGDDRNGNSLIQTIPRRGYRFVASVRQIEASAVDTGGLGQPSSLIADYWNCHSPFRSLQTFEPEDSWLFFGRDHEINELLEKLGRFPVLAVIGNSGCGKSSLVRAGLVPALKGGRFLQQNAAVDSWRIAIFRPSASPFDYLADVLANQLAPELSLQEHTEFIASCRNKIPSDPTALRDAITALVNTTEQQPEKIERTRVLLIADQFEELFTLTTKQQTREAYINALIAASGINGAIGIHVVLVLRADFYGQCLEHEELSRALQTNLYNVPRMSPKQLRDSMERRLQMAAAQAEPGLIESLLEEVGAEPGNLALLEHALGQLWDRCGGFGCTLTNQAYSDIGRLRGALGRHADEVYTSLGSVQSKKLAQKIFLELVHLGEEAGRGSSNDTRRRVSKSTLLSLGEPNEVEQLLARLASSRLISTGESEQSPYVEVSHEALIREWSTLREWIAIHRDSMRLERRLLRAVQEWEEVKRDPGALLQGARLAQAEEWLANSRNPPSSVCEFLQASAAARQEAAIKEHQIQQLELARQRASMRRFRRFSVGLAALLILAVATTWLVRKQQLIAESRALAAQAQQLQSQDQPSALGMALRAWHRAHTPEARLAVTSSFPQLLLTLQGHTDVIQMARISEDGQRVVTAGRDHTARVWNAINGQLLIAIQTPSVVWDARLSPDGQRVLTVNVDNTVRIWSAANGQLLITLRHPDTVSSAAFSPDNQRIVTGNHDHTARIWNASTGQLLAVLQGHTSVIYFAAFSPNGQFIVTGGHDPTARVWSATTGELLTILQGHSDEIGRAAFSSDSKHIVTASVDGTARVWDTASGKLLIILRHPGWVMHAAFSRDGQRILTASVDHSARLWNAADGRLMATFQGHPGPVSNATFSPDERYILTSSTEQTRIWSAANGQWVATIQGESYPATFFPDGQRILIVSANKMTAQIWSSISAELLASLQGHTNILSSARFSPDGQRVVTASYDGTARIWNAAGGQVLAVLRGHSNKVYGAEFSPDGQSIVTASTDHTAKVWNAVDGRLRATLSGHSNDVYSALFSANSRHIVTTSEDSTARVWNAADGQLLTTLRGHTRAVEKAGFSPDGRRIVTASDDQTARIWEATTGNLVITLQGHTSGVLEARFSPDGRRIVTASLDHTARIWDAITGALLKTLQHTDIVVSVSFSRDGQHILTGGYDGIARLWDATTGQVLVTFQGHSGGISVCAFSHNGSRVLTASSDRTARLWDANNGKSVAIFQGHPDSVWAVASSAGDQRIVTVSQAGVRVLRMITLPEIAELLAH